MGTITATTVVEIAGVDVDDDYRVQLRTHRRRVSLDPDDAVALADELYAAAARALSLQAADRIRPGLTIDQFALNAVDRVLAVAGSDVFEVGAPDWTAPMRGADVFCGWLAPGDVDLGEKPRRCTRRPHTVGLHVHGNGSEIMAVWS